ncbi:hypothetical protein [Zoogloea sp.]|uniref:hypothetical protein n=1 Tax=Zoogloea sp. TaxID=49181 RepID=UPI0035AF7580
MSTAAPPLAAPDAPALEAERDRHAGLVLRICARLDQELARHGLPTLAIDPHRAECSLRVDSYSQECVLVLRWAPDDAGRGGNLTINGDGSFFAEHDVLVDHPSLPRQFVEATTAWGRGERMGSELRLIPWPDEA